MDSTVIRIRYRELSAGLHGKAQPAGRSTTIYLCPGLTGAQRHAVLRRLRQESRMGCGPRLAGPPLAVAIGADRIRTAAGRIIAVVRLHPAAALAPPLLLGAVAALLVAAVPARVARPPGHGAVSPQLAVRMVGWPGPASPARCGHGQRFGYGNISQYRQPCP